MTITKEQLSKLIGVGIHTSLRTLCESKESKIAWIAIDTMPGLEWRRVCDAVAEQILAAHQTPADEADHDAASVKARWG